MGDLTVFERDDVLSLLKPNVVMLGLNFSKLIEQPRPFHNFHVAGSAQDYKTRYAFTDSEYSGANPRLLRVDLQARANLQRLTVAVLPGRIDLRHLRRA